MPDPATTLPPVRISICAKFDLRNVENMHDARFPATAMATGSG